MLLQRTESAKQNKTLCENQYMIKTEKCSDTFQCSEVQYSEFSVSNQWDLNSFPEALDAMSKIKPCLLEIPLRPDQTFTVLYLIFLPGS